MVLPALRMSNLCGIKLNTNSDFNNNLPTRKATRRCIFGKSEPQDTSKLLAEQMENDRQMMIARFGINIENLENLPAHVFQDVKQERIGKIRGSSERKSKMDRVFKPYNYQQPKITDLCPVEKSGEM